MTEIDCKATVPGPKRVSPSAKCGASPPDLIDRRHRERARAFQPNGVSGSLIELQQRVAVAACAMAQVRPLDERTGFPSQLAPTKQKGLERRCGKRNIGKRCDDARCAVAMLAQ